MFLTFCDLQMERLTSQKAQNNDTFCSNPSNRRNFMFIF